MSGHFALDPEMTEADWEAAHRLANMRHLVHTAVDCTDDPCQVKDHYEWR